MITPPQTWYDVHHFLEQEGYHLVFQTRHRRNRSWLSKVTEIMRSNKSHLDWHKQWVIIALSDEEGYPSPPILESENIRIFFEVAEFLYFGNDTEALRLLNLFRKTHQFTTFLAEPPRSFQANGSHGLARGIAMKQGKDGVDERPGRHSFNDTTSTTVTRMNGLRSRIPSGLHIPGYARSDSPLSSLSDDEQVIPEIVETSQRGVQGIERVYAAPSLKRRYQAYHASAVETIQITSPSNFVNERRSKSCQDRALRRERRAERQDLQGVQKDSVAPSHKRACRTRHESAVETVQGKRLGGLIVEQPSKKLRPCIQPSPRTPPPPMVTAIEPMFQPTSEPESSQNIDVTRVSWDDSMCPQDRFATAAPADPVNLPSDLWKTPPPQRSSSLLETATPSTSELINSDDTLVMSSSPRMPAKLDHAADLISPGSMLGLPSDHTAAYMGCSESFLHVQTSLSFTSAYPSMEAQEAASSLLGSPSPSDDACSEDSFVSEESDRHYDGSTHIGNGYDLGALPPATIPPSLSTEINSIRCGMSSENEPPWRRLVDLSSPPSNARLPNMGDTHFWSLPERTSVEHEPLMLPEFLPQPLDPLVAYNTVRKPDLPVAPPVWAQSRQELCESVRYFRSYQGGVYSSKKRARGYLLDGHPAIQDLWHAGGKCIISHAGGNSAIDKITGQTVLIDDQTCHSKSCNALLTSWRIGQAVVLIAGNAYNLFPYDLGDRTYVVLGYYLITHAWEEPERSAASPRGYFVRWKFMFQWIQSQGRPWWIQSDTQTDHFSDLQGRVTSRICQCCFRASHNIYNFGWVCTRSDCKQFFRRVDAPVPFQDATGFHPDFLTLRGDPPELQGSIFEIRPKAPVEPKVSGNKELCQPTTSRRFWKGWWCDECGRLSCREYWTYWECNTCHQIYEIKSKIQPPPGGVIPRIKTLIHPSRTAAIGMEVRTICTGPDKLRCQSFRLPFNRGIIHLLQAEEAVQNCATSIWYQYQLDAKKPDFFRRYSMKCHKLKGRMLSHYFSQNSGEPYEYVGGTNNTVPLHTYKSVSQALTMIRKQVSLVLAKDPAFNEVLSAAYMAEQKMEFHSDGEKDLGPIVASLSLGSSATMRFRPIPSRWSTEGLPEALVRKSPPIVLTLTLQHGDVLIMEGAEIQEYYQHAVHPSGFRIAATARRIERKDW